MIKIPISFVIEMDDVGWDNGRDLRLSGKASRSGIPRNHEPEDYEVLKEISDRSGKNLVCALCLGDWDKNNLLRGEVGITHDPYGWDRASEIDLEKTARCRDILESAEHVEYMLHALLHGVYDAEGRQLTEHEFYTRSTNAQGESIPLILPEDDFNRRLDLFFRIYDSWGFKKPVKSFVVPNGVKGMSYETVLETTRRLYKYGIRYWSDSFTFPETVRVINGVACFKWGKNGFLMPWNAYDMDPVDFGPFVTEENDKNSCLLGSHWTNFLRFNPKKNCLNVDRWISYYEKQSEYFGTALASSLSEAVNQLFHYEYAKISSTDIGYEIDLTLVVDTGFEELCRDFLISFTKDEIPKNCIGANLSLYEEKKGFSTYKVEYHSPKIVIETKKI